MKINSWIILATFGLCALLPSITAQFHTHHHIPAIWFKHKPVQHIIGLGTVLGTGYSLALLGAAYGKRGRGHLTWHSGKLHHHHSHIPQYVPLVHPYDDPHGWKSFGYGIHGNALHDHGISSHGHGLFGHRLYGHGHKYGLNQHGLGLHSGGGHGDLSGLHEGVYGHGIY